MFDYYRYRHNSVSVAAQPNDPIEIGLFVYSDGRCRLNRRGNDHRLDSWYATFDDVAPVLAAMQRNARYVLAMPEPQDGAPMDADMRKKHAAYLREVAQNDRKDFPYYRWLYSLPREHECAEAPLF